MIVPRSLYLDRVLELLDTPPMKVITGMRRVGKSTILRSVAASLHQGGVPAQNVVSYNFESMSLAPLTNADALYRDVLSRVSGLEGRVYLLLDEVQEVAGWERVVASLKVDLDCDIVVTGSSATLLASELATRLAGRYIEIRIWPLSFGEFLDFKRKAGTEPVDEARADGLSLTSGAPIWEYLRFGGMPGIHELPPDADIRDAYLSDVFNSVLLRDVVSRHRLRDVDLLSRLTAFVASNLGHTFSASSVTRFMKSQDRRLGSETVYRYLQHLEEAFALRPVRRVEVKRRRLLETQEKYFFEDHALRHTLLGYDARELPGVLENVVCVELARRGFRVGVGQLPGGEIDFVADKGGVTVYIQVAYLLADPAIERREFAALEAVRDNHAKTVVSMDAAPGYSRNGIRRRPLPEFLLDPDW